MNEVNEATLAELRAGLGQIAVRVSDDPVMVKCCRLIDEALTPRTRSHSEPTILALITANQAQTLLDAFGGSATSYGLVAFAEGECAPLDDGSPSPAGLYVYDLNCPEEGLIYLGDEDEDSVPRDDTQRAPESRGVALIADERHRHTSEEGWTPEHDREHTNFALSSAACCYAQPGAGGPYSNPTAGQPPEGWPWAPSWWKPSENAIRNLVKAGSLIAAEIDRLLAATDASPAEEPAAP